MGIRATLASWLGVGTVSKTETVTRSRYAPIRARYDAAILDDDNRKHWGNADSLSARSANNPGVRQRLRDHARYEVANNCYARGIVNTIADVTVGYGPTLTLKRSPQTTREQSAGLREVARLFVAWATEVDLWGKLWTMRVAKCQDGEAFAVLRNNPRLRSMVQLDLQLIEAEQVTDGYNADWWDPTKVDGVETDDLGNPVAYTILPQHPGDGVAWDRDPIRLDARLVCHWYRKDRPGQLRGIPEITPALPLFAQLRRFTLATLTAAETAADFAAVLESDNDPDDPTQIEPFETLEIDKGLYTTLPGGAKLSQLKAEHPTTTYEMFKREILCEVGRALGQTKAATLLDASGYNYSSYRADKQTSDRGTQIEQYQCAVQVLGKIWDAWITEAQLMPGFLPEAVDGLQLDPMWLWPELGHVDRKKESDGAAQDLANHTTTLAAEIAKTGEDWEEVLEQRAAEQARLQELGLVTSAVAQPQGAGNGNDQDGADSANDDRVGNADAV